jgi:hypothetical protein
MRHQAISGVDGRDAKPWIASEFTVNPYGILHSACKIGFSVSSPARAPGRASYRKSRFRGTRADIDDAEYAVIQD